MEEDIECMKHGQNLTNITMRFLNGMLDVFKECCLDVALMHGDTTTSTAALAKLYAQISVVHTD